MTIKIFSNDKRSRRYLKNRTNEFFNTQNKDWINRTYLYTRDILFFVSNSGVFLDSLSEADEIYDLVGRYIEFLFLNMEISIYGSYDIKKLFQVNGVKILEL